MNMLHEGDERCRSNGTKTTTTKCTNAKQKEKSFCTYEKKKKRKFALFDAHKYINSHR